MIIAITGSIGSGKSYYLHKIHEIYGYEIFSCDAWTLEAYEDKKIIKQLDDVFFCLKNGVIDKKIIKEKLNEKNIIILNKIIHPFISEKILSVKEKFNNNIAFIEVPLLFESNMQDLFDASICISVDEDLRNKRLINRNPNSYLFMKELEEKQLSSKEKEALSTFVLKSDDDEENNLKKLNDIINIIKNIQG